MTNVRIDEIVRYVTDDGVEHESYGDATAHVTLTDYHRKIEEVNKLCGDDTAANPVELDSLLEFLSDNRTLLMNYLSYLGRRSSKK